MVFGVCSCKIVYTNKSLISIGKRVNKKKNPLTAPVNKNIYNEKIQIRNKNEIKRIIRDRTIL